MNRVAQALVRLVQGLLVLMLAAMVLLVFANVILRYGFNSGIVFSEEASRFIFMWLTALGAILALHEGAHLGMTSVVERLPRGGQRLCRALSDLVIAICCGLLAHGAWKQVVLGMSERAPVTGIPLGWVYAGLLTCAVAMSASALFSLAMNATGRLDAAALGRSPGEPQAGAE